MDYVTARKNMVESQIRTNKVTSERIVAAMLDLAREEFVPAKLKGAAYLDEDLPVAPGRFLMEPMVLARLLQYAEVKPSDKVLDLGGATGYSAALVSYLAGSVVAVESDADLAAQAKPLLAKFGKAPVTLVQGDLKQGAKAHGPYDVILFAGTVAEVPAAVLEQLSEGGRLLAVLQSPRIGRATLITRQGNTFPQRQLFDAQVPVLPGFERQEAFVF